MQSEGSNRICQGALTQLQPLISTSLGTNQMQHLYYNAIHVCMSKFIVFFGGKRLACKPGTVQNYTYASVHLRIQGRALLRLTDAVSETYCAELGSTLYYGVTNVTV